MPLLPYINFVLFLHPMDFTYSAPNGLYIEFGSDLVSLVQKQKLHNDFI